MEIEMVFIVDRKKYKTYDPERGYELFAENGGSDGVTKFRIAGPGSECVFYASSIGENLFPDEIFRLGEKYPEKVVVWRVYNWPDGWEVLIREALEAYIINHGSPLPNVRAFVRFGEAGGVFDV